MVTNPIYGGAYAYGRTTAVTRYSGPAVGTRSRRKPREEWLALTGVEVLLCNSDAFTEGRRRRLVENADPTTRPFVDLNKDDGAPENPKVVTDVFDKGLVMPSRWPRVKRPFQK
jgi:hypothetical protein